MTIWSLAQGHQGLPLSKWEHYFPIYQRHLARFVERPVLLVEIGVALGGSLQLWRRFLGSQCQVVGVDIRPECAGAASDGVKIRIGDQAAPAFWAAILGEFGAPDIVIDDGSHKMSDTLSAFRCLYNAMKPDGVYLVEDMHTSYWPEYGGGCRRPGTLIELSKELVDELNAVYTRGAIDTTSFTRETFSISFYDSVVAFERAPQRFPRQQFDLPTRKPRQA